MSCASCFRGFLSFVIILNMILGLAIVGTSIWLYLDGGVMWEFLYRFNIGPLMGEINCYHYILYALLILGSIKVCMSFIACCDVSRKFFILVLLVLGIQIAAGVCMWYFKDAFLSKSEETLTLFVQERYRASKTEGSDQAFDSLQTMYKCCGSVAPSDWSQSMYSDISNEGTENYYVPESCCIQPQSETCPQDRVIKGDSILMGTIFQNGCSKHLFEPVMQYIYRYETLGILAGYVLLEFLVMTLKLFVCRKRYADYDSNMMELKPYR